MINSKKLHLRTQSILAKRGLGHLMFNQEDASYIQLFMSKNGPSANKPTDDEWQPGDFSASHFTKAIVEIVREHSNGKRTIVVDSKCPMLETSSFSEIFDLGLFGGELIDLVVVFIFSGIPKQIDWGQVKKIEGVQQAFGCATVVDIKNGTATVVSVVI